MAELIQTAIFKIRETIHELDETGILIKTDITLALLKIRFQAEGYKIQKLNDGIIDTHDLLLFYKGWPSPIKWKDFIATIAREDQEILEIKDSINEGFVLLVKNKKNKRIYSIAGGMGHFLLQNYCDYEFGLDVLSRIIKTEDKVLKAVKERNFTGGILGSVKYFRGDYNLNENESFGNFYQELSAKLNNTILKSIFGFTDDELKKGNLCVAKSSFTLKKPVSFQKSIQIIENLDTLLKSDPIVDLNLVKKLSKSDNALIKKLNTKLRLQLYELYRNKSVDINVELCHKDFDKYYDADSYEASFSLKSKREEMPFEYLNNFKSLISLYKKQSINIIDKKSFEQALDSTYIESLDESGVAKTTGNVLDHLCAEVKIGRMSYFLINKEWYYIKTDFETQLNEECQDFIDNDSIDGLLQNWDSLHSENQFNEKHIGNDSTLVFDKICPANIEVCDILKWTKNTVYFIHVKEGFNNEMRNLCRQIQIAARRVHADLRSGREFLKSHYDELNNMNALAPYFINAKKQLTKFSQDGYLKLFDNRKPVFVLAVLDTAKSKRSLKDISVYESSIAKFCLQKLIQDMRLLNVEFKITQIFRP